MRAPGCFARKASASKPDDVVALDERALRVEEEAAVVVAVPGDADIGAGLLERLERRAAVFLEHRVRHAVRERAVGFVAHLDELERQVRLELVDREPRAAVARVDHDLELAQHLAVHVAEQVIDVVLRGVEMRDLALRGGAAAVVCRSRSAPRCP